MSQSEIFSILHATTNMKYKAIIMIAYSAGLRVSEVTNLKLTDIDTSNMQILVRSGKGDKDRYALLAKKTLDCLYKYQKKPINQLNGSFIQGTIKIVHYRLVVPKQPSKERSNQRVLARMLLSIALDTPLLLNSS